MYPDTNPYWGGYYITGGGMVHLGEDTSHLGGSSTKQRDVAWKEQYGIAVSLVATWIGNRRHKHLQRRRRITFPTIVYGGRSYKSLITIISGKDESKQEPAKTAVPY